MAATLSSFANLQALAKSAERAIHATTNINEADGDDDDEQKRALLSRLRRALDLCDDDDRDDRDGDHGTARQREIAQYRRLLRDLEQKYRADRSERAAKLAQQHAADRVALLSSSSTGRGGVASSSTGGGGGSAQLLFKSREANESLVRTRNIIVQQLGRVTEVGAVLNSDAEKLRDTDKELHDYANSLSTSGSMIKTLQRREYTDRVLVYAGFGFVVLVALYIVFKRVRHLISPLVWLAEVVYGSATAAASSSSSESGVRTDL